MTALTVGDQVTIRYGRHQGESATVLKCQPANVYLVKAADGTVLFYSGKGLDAGEARPTVSAKR